jgi:hypothetical protein
MIPAEGALLLWIFVSIGLMADRNSARAFAIAYIGALLFLPENAAIDLPGMPSLGKRDVATIGVLIGTILFHPRIFDKLKIAWPDIFLVGAMQLVFATGLVNDDGYFTATSRAVQFGLEFAAPVFLARLHIGTPRDIRTFLVILIFGSVIYAPLAVWEFRMSPQLHTNTYGYFQHVFAQHQRGGYFRPIVYFEHALSLGRFFAFTAFMALLPMRRDFVDMFGRYGKFVFLIPLTGLIVSQSMSPYLLFAMLCTGYFALKKYTWALYALPVFAFVWVGLVLANMQPLFFMVSDISTLNADRAQSFGYRLRAWQDHVPVVWEQPMLGYGGFGRGRLENVAIDAQALNSILVRGILGSVLFYAWWIYALFATVNIHKIVPNSILAKRARGIALMIALGILISAIDKALGTWLLLLAGGSVGVYMWLVSHQSSEELEPSLNRMMSRSSQERLNQTTDPPS